MRRSAALLAVTCLLAGEGCSEEKKERGAGKAPAASESAETGGAKTTSPAPVDEAAPAPAQAGRAQAASLDPAALAARIGVEPGPLEYDPGEGSAAVVASARGKAEIRRVGMEIWEEVRADAPLHEGDQVRASEGGLVNLTLVDETAVELAEESAVAIGSRKVTADPASSAALLYGVARFTVAARAPGEGPFLTFTPGGVIAAKGTVYTAGVAASGVTRVGVEAGAVEVAGSARLDAPVAVAAGQAVVVAPAGEVGAPGAVGDADADWGAWRDGAEADLDTKTAAEFHARRAQALEAELEAAYAELEVQTAAAADAEAKAEAAEQARDPAAYRAAAPEVGGAVDASFAMSLRLEYLTSAMLAHAYVADALYVRHPEVVAVIEPARPRLAGAVLWQKKYQVVADLHVEPLRAYYYVHHPVGRVHARLVAYRVPPFYARVRLDYPAPVVTGRVKLAVYRPPVVITPAHGRIRKTVYVRAPRIGWYAGVKARVHPAPARVHWYVQPKAPRSRVVFGARPSGSVKVKAVFVAAPPTPRVRAVVRFAGPRDQHAPQGGGRVDLRGQPAAAVKIKAGVRAGGGAPARVEVRDRRGGEAAGARARVGVKVKGPRIQVNAPKVRPPRVKGSVKVKAGVRVGK